MLAVINKGKCSHSPTHCLLTIYGYSTVMDHVTNEQTEVVIQSKLLTSKIVRIIVVYYNS